MIGNMFVSLVCYTSCDFSKSVSASFMELRTDVHLPIGVKSHYYISEVKGKVYSFENCLLFLLLILLFFRYKILKKLSK